MGISEFYPNHTQNAWRATLTTATTTTETVTVTMTTAGITTDDLINSNNSSSITDDFEVDTVTDLSAEPVLMLWAIINALLLLAILGGNMLTIVAVRTCRILRSMISNMFILSLAVSDLVVGLSLPYHVAFYLGSDLGKLRGYCLLRFFLFICACCVSILTLISIAVDRYIAIIYPLHYRRYMTRRVAYAIIGSSWALGAFVALIPIFWNNWSAAEQCEFDEVLSPGYIAGIITPAFVVIWLCMLLLYWRIMREASKQAKRLHQALAYPDWKSVQIVVFIMGSFSICWLPYFCVAVAQLFGLCRSSSTYYKVAFSLAMTNSALNPIIYSWKNSNFRLAFAQTLCCCKLSTASYCHCYCCCPQIAPETMSSSHNEMEINK